MPAETLPAVWKTRTVAFSVPELRADLADSLPGSARHDLLTALRHAEARSGQDPWGSPEHVRYAQAVLEIAVQWAMPAVERWAVAWLTASGESYLRLRWSSRSRDGRTRRDALLPSPVSAVTADAGRAIIGCESGYVAGWTDDAGLSVIHDPAGPDSAVWAVACQGNRVFAAHSGGRVRTHPDGWTVPAPGENLNFAVRTAAISRNGDVACGDNTGGLLICPAGADWLPPLRPAGDRSGVSIVALSFDGRSSAWAIWEDGRVTETRRGPDGSWGTGPAGRPPGRPVTAAAFDGACERAAIGYADGRATVLHLSAMTEVPAWSGDDGDRRGPRVRSVTWSPGGLLAVSRTGSLLFGEPGREPEQISGDGTGDRMAFLDDDHLVTASEREIVGWAIHDIGSDVPDPLRNTITAVAVDPLDPGRTMVGTRRGGVVQYDEHGSATPLVKDEGRVVGQVKIIGQVNELDRMGDDWLVAAQGGAYRVAPEGQVSALPGPGGLASYICLSVAGMDREGQPPDGAYACGDRVCTVSGADPLTLARAVLDIRCGADGTTAAISDDGSIVARDGAGTGWALPGPRLGPGRPGRSGWRLLAADAESVTVWNPAGQTSRDSDGQVQRLSRYGQDLVLGRLPAGAIAALDLGAGKLAVACPDRGVGIISIGDHEHTGQITSVNTRVTLIGASGRKIVVAAGQWLAGYDLMPGADDAEAGDDAAGVIRITVKAKAGSCQVRLPRGDVIELDADLLGQFGASSRSKPADSSLARVVNAAIQIGDQLWRCGLDRALDLARGDDPDRPVCLVWDCDSDNAGLPWRLDDLPWELVHPAMYPLGWFADPPITSVRSVRRPEAAEPTAPDVSGAAGTLVTRHRMQVIRGVADELGSSDEAYLHTSRRTRLRSVKMLDARPVHVATRDDLYEALREPVDIMQVWAHCGPDRTEFSAAARFGTDELAGLLAPRVSRLAVIVGCRSGALARALVGRGVEAVVAMRTEVFSGTVQPLVADLIALVLGGMRIDLAFGRALHSYMLTGQPGAAAVPMLYLADGSTGELFGHNP